MERFSAKFSEEKGVYYVFDDKFKCSEHNSIGHRKEYSSEDDAQKRADNLNELANLWENVPKEH